MNALPTRSCLLRTLLAFVLLACAPLALAQTVASTSSALPVHVTAAGNRADIVIGPTSSPLADVSLDFEDASGLSPASLGVAAHLVDPTDPALLARLPDASLTSATGAFPLMLTIEPPAAGGLSFRGTGRMEIHTHALPYTVGSSLRVFKAPLGGAFRDVTDEIAQGSVRARTTYGGFSQFLILVDLRGTGTVIAEKLAMLRTRVSALPYDEAAPLAAIVDRAEAALDASDPDGAIAAIDEFRARVQARGGQHIANEWRATRDVENHAGQMIADANSLRFSIAYLRDFGQ